MIRLKHVANHEAEVVAHNLANPDSPRHTDHRFVPSAVFTEPEIASVGLTEEQCRARLERGGGRYVDVVQDYGSVALGQYWINPALPEIVENSLLRLELD